MPSHGFIIDTDHNGAFFVRALARPLRIVGVTFPTIQGDARSWSATVTACDAIISRGTSRAEALGALLIALLELEARQPDTTAALNGAPRLFTPTE
jgi:hypothetical protein